MLFQFIYKYFFWIHFPSLPLHTSTSPFNPLCLPTEDKPCPCPPLTPSRGGEGRAPSVPQKPEWLRAASIHWGNKRSLCQKERGGRREPAIDTSATWADMLLITLCNMQQKNWYPKWGSTGSGGMWSNTGFSSWIRGPTNTFWDKKHTKHCSGD